MLIISHSLFPGQSEATWDVRILDDGLLENTENLVVYIHQPVNAVLGRKKKLRIRLINAEDGMSTQTSLNAVHYYTVLDTTLSEDGSEMCMLYRKRE